MSRPSALVLSLALGCASCNSHDSPPARSPVVTETRAPNPPAPAPAASESTGLAAGAVLTVKLHEVLDSDAPLAQKEYVSADVPDDIKGADGGLAFPAGSHALLAVRQANREKNISTLTLALNSIFVGNRQVKFSDGIRDLAFLTFTENAADGPEHRTVHLTADTVLRFKLSAPVSLR